MAELFRDSSVTLDLGIATAYEITATFVRDGVVVHEAEGNTVAIPFKIMGYDGPFEVRWQFFVTGDPILHTRYEAHEVVTPLVELDTIDEPDMTDTEKANAERLVRRIIQGLTGQTFGFTYGAVAVIGSGERSLNLPKRLIHLDGVSYNYYPYDRVPFGAITVSNGGWSLTTQYGNDYFPSVKHAPPEDAIYTANGVIVAPGYVHKWQPDVTYLVTGSWGWEGVPVEVSEAARLLIDDYNCAEDTYRNKFIANMRSADWRIEYDPRTWSGTGNIKADQLIAQYVRSGYGII
jgi:hypothetical protein